MKERVEQSTEENVADMWNSGGGDLDCYLVACDTMYPVRWLSVFRWRQVRPFSRYNCRSGLIRKITF